MGRQVIHVPGLGHGEQPIPLAVKVGNMVFTGSLGGSDPKTGETPSDPEQQIANAFAAMTAVMEAAGGSLSDVAKVEVRLADRGMRKLLNKAWIKAFPDENDRPCRHTGEGGTGGGGNIIQMEIVAVLGA